MAARNGTTVTMQDVAAHAGVSVQTVSNVVNGRSSRVSAATRDRVAASISALGYRVNQSARSLRRGRTGTVGLALPKFDSEYYGAFAEALSLRFAERGIRLVTEHTGGVVSAEIDALASSHLDAYDGFVLALATGDAVHLESVRATKPIVLVGERALTSRFDHLLMDNVGGAKAATQLLLRHGARRIVALGGTTSHEESMHSLRTRGYLEALSAAGVGADPGLVVSSGFDQAGGFEGLQRMIARGGRFDAVFAVTDAAAIGALRALADAGLRVPNDVEVIGFDNVDAGAYSTPRLTTVDPDNDARADSVVELMMARFEEGAAPLERRIVVHPAALIERESTRSEATQPR
ncbi:LacI family DNA-binding transcriptional regulator [Microbacterium halophytorum]|uniref:LacI family DNA-binding transcriptional regulator n=1 Tax=Microbacterium halophytorum TaxID=2067568 RepID=UPI000CFA940E|nr:LacI family DNA-binding transcriptional regulator [Microbacterium halophytorum]